MGGMSLDAGGGGGKKSVDMVIPLVPFIDMLAMMITFLMMTAVWTQIGRMQVASQGQGDPSPNNQPTLQLNLTVTEKGYMLNAGASAIEIPKLNGAFDRKTLGEKLKTLKTSLPDQSAITVQPEDSVAYADLVETVDTAMGEHLRNVTVAPAN